MINYRKYGCSYAGWAWPSYSNMSGTIYNIINFFAVLKRDRIIDYELLEMQTDYGSKRHVTNEEITSYPTHGKATAIRYTKSAGSLHIYWQGIPIKPNTIIIFGIYYEATSMYFIRADTNSAYFYPLRYDRANYKYFTLAPFKQQ